jgi:hypothetical protein
MKRRVLIGCGIVAVILVLGAVALLSGQEAVRRDKAQAQLEGMLDFAYGPLTYMGEVFSGDEVSGHDYIIFEDSYYTYQLDAGSGALKSMIARHLPQGEPVSLAQLQKLIAQAQPVLAERAAVRLVDGSGRELSGDSLPGDYFALCKEPVEGNVRTGKEALALIQDGQIRYLITIQSDYDPPMGAASASRGDAIRASYSRARALSSAGQRQVMRPDSPYWDTEQEEETIRMDQEETHTISCALAIYRNAPYWRVTIGHVPVGDGFTEYTFGVDMFTGNLLEDS